MLQWNGFADRKVRGGRDVVWPVDKLINVTRKKLPACLSTHFFKVFYCSQHNSGTIVFLNSYPFSFFSTFLDFFFLQNTCCTFALGR